MKGVEQLKEMMIGKVSMFQDILGLSTLVNAMEPSLHLKQKVISEASKQGQLQPSLKCMTYLLCQNHRYAWLLRFWVVDGIAEKSAAIFLNF
jgi:hypothetical protein